MPFKLRQPFSEWPNSAEARYEQLSTLEKQTTPFLVLILLNTLIASTVSWGCIHTVGVMWWGGSVVLAAGFWFAVRARFRIGNDRNAKSGSQHRALAWNVIAAILMGSVWGIGVWILYDNSAPATRQLLMILTVATSAVGAIAFSVMPRTVIAFVVPAAAPIFIGAAIDGHLAPLATIMTGSVFLVAIVLAAWIAFKAFAANVSARLALIESNLVISLLLKDFEDTSSDWLWETDSQLRFTKLSERGEQGIRVSRDSILGKTPREMSEKNAANDPTWAHHLDDLDRHVPFHDFIYESHHADGSVTWISVSGKPRFDRDGNFLGYRGVMSDVTAKVVAEEARQEAEARLRHSHEELERRVDERTKELRENEARLVLARDAAEAASRAKDDFIANISHELRTPLNAIIGLSEIMATETIGKLDNPDYLQFSGEIHSSGLHLLEIVNDILDLSKSQTGKLRLDTAPLQLATVVEECLPIIADQSHRRGVELKTDIAAELPVIQGDRLRLKQVMLNLLSNAVKFTEPGGTVSIEAEAAACGGIEVRVSDSGIGMTEQQIKIALEPFGQVDNSLSRTNQGTGLGLPLAQRLVGLHGGTLGVVSEPDKGTTVTIVLPALDAAAPAGRNDAPRAAGGSV